MIGLALGSWRAHVSGYLTVIVAVGASAALLSGLFTVVFSSGALADGVDSAAASYAEATSVVAGMTTGVGAFAAVFVIATTLGFVLDARTKELALFRLVGASPRQVTRMVRVEVLIFALFGALLGMWFGVPVGALMIKAFIAAEVADPSFAVVWSPAAMGCAVALALLVSWLGAWGPSRRSGRAAPLQALTTDASPRRTMGWARWLLAVGSGAGAVAVGFLGTDLDVSVMAVLGSSWLMVIAMTAIAPVAVPVAVGLVGSVIRWCSPGVGLLSSADAHFHARRTASLAAPLILTVGIYAGLATITTTLSVTRLSPTEPAVVLQNAETDAALAWCGEQPEVSACTPVLDAEIGGSTAGNGVMFPGAVRVVDPVTFEALGPQVLAGSLTDLTGDTVAAPSWQDLGTVINLDTSTGQQPVTINVTIDRTIVDGEQPDMYLTFDQAAELGISGASDVWLMPSQGVSATELQDLVASSGLGGSTLTSAEVAQQRADDFDAQQQMALISLLGAAQVLALVSVVITVLSGIRDKSGATRLLQRIGMSRGQLLGSSVAEIALVVVVAAVVALGVPLWMWWRMSGLDLGTPVIVPWGELAILLGLGAALALISAVAGTAWQLRRSS